MARGQPPAADEGGPRADAVVPRPHLAILWNKYDLKSILHAAMTDPRIAIEVRRVTKRFGRRLVLDEIDLDVAAGESIVLTGSNGAGKTTLLRAMAALVRPSSGEVFWFGEKTTGQYDSRRWIGMVAHENRLYPHLTLRENLVFAARMCDVAARTIAPSRCWKRWGCRPRRSHAAGAFEGHAAAVEPRPGVDP